MARGSDGTVVAWGDNSGGQCNVQTLPVGVTYVEVAAGYLHTVALLSDGAVLVFGNIGAAVPSLPAGATYGEVAAGWSHALARRSDGQVVAWGYNAQGQCNVPSLPAGLTILELGAKGFHSVARFGLSSTCANTTIVYCSPKVNAIGCTPAIGFAGTPSASTGSGFVVSGRRVLNNEMGLLFFGTNGSAAAPFLGGTLCVNRPIQRTPIVDSGGNPPPSDCSGVYSIDMNQFAANGSHPALTVAGTVVNCQWWGRDPGFVVPNNASLSNGLEYTICP